MSRPRIATSKGLIYFHDVAARIGTPGYSATTWFQPLIGESMTRDRQSAKRLTIWSAFSLA